MQQSITEQLEKTNRALAALRAEPATAERI
jgi:hypothetical protein